MDPTWTTTPDSPVRGAKPSSWAQSHVIRLRTSSWNHSHDPLFQVKEGNSGRPLFMAVALKHGSGCSSFTRCPLQGCPENALVHLCQDPQAERVTLSPRSYLPQASALLGLAGSSWEETITLPGAVPPGRDGLWRKGGSDLSPADSRLEPDTLAPDGQLANGPDHRYMGSITGRDNFSRALKRCSFRALRWAKRGTTSFSIPSLSDSGPRHPSQRKCGSPSRSDTQPSPPPSRSNS